MLDAVAYPLRARPAPVLPIARIVTGQPVGEVAALLPRLFNLCREAQGIAARAAFGLPQDDNWQRRLRTEIVREHVIKLCMKWPGLMSLRATVLPRDWQNDTAALQEALFGSDGALPADMAGFETWLRADHGVASTLGAIADLFEPGEAVRSALPLTTAQSVFAQDAQENSVAARCAAYPVLQGIEAYYGRGPLWSAVAVAVDLDRLLLGAAPELYAAPGQAVVTAARGLYGVTARVEDGIVTAFQRITPTDHLLAPGGGLAQALATLPDHKASAFAPLLLSVMDPCFPVSFETAKELPNA